jgi:hypothetical protein
MSRWKAAGIHFSLSLTIATILVSLMFALWYPPPYFTLMGGATLVFLLAGCDVVLGPLITLIIFKSGKKGLRFDLSVIGCVQVLALAYGLNTMFEARPVFTVFNIDRFEIVSAQDIKGEELAKAARPEFKTLPLTGPRIVGGVKPEDPEEAWRIAAHGDIKSYPRLYVPYEALAAEAARHAKPLRELERNSPALHAELRERLARYATSPDNRGYLKVEGLFRDTVAIVDRNSGRIEEIVAPPLW